MDIIENITTNNPKEDLLNIKNHYDLTNTELSSLFHIPINLIEQYLKCDCKMDDKQREQTLSTEIAAISMYHTQNIDFRIKSYLDELYARHQITSTILSKLTGIEEQQIDAFTKDPASASAEVKCILCVQAVYLLFLFSQRSNDWEV